jgi:hypothetical protein
MKHLLNNLTEQEKNAIRSQYTGSLNVVTENFKKLINSKLGDVKTILSEKTDIEPVFTDNPDDAKKGSVIFDENQTTFKDPKMFDKAVDTVASWIKPNLTTIKAFHKSNNPQIQLPKFIKLYVGTSSTGSPDSNSMVAQGRMATLNRICLKAFEKLGIRADVAYKLIVQSYDEYTPSQVDGEFYDTTKVKPNKYERMCTIVVEPIVEKGRNNNQIGDITGDLIDASSIVNTWIVDGVNEKGIVDGIKKLQTYSDIKDLDRALYNARMGTLEYFLNKQLFDDPNEREEVINHLNKCSQRSKQKNIASDAQNGGISIIF